MPKHAAAGNNYSFIVFLDSEGLPTGGTPTAPSNGAASGAYRVLGVKEVAVSIPAPEVVQATGDNTVIAEFQFDSTEQRTYEVTMAVGDLALESYFAGTNVETIAGGSFVLNDVDGAPARSIALIHQSNAVKQDTGLRGVQGWSGTLVPLATAKYLGRDSFSERTAGTYRLSVTPQTATNYPWGVSFSTASGKNSGRFIDFDSDYPYTMAAFRGDNAAVQWTLDYQPVNAASVGAWHYRTAVNVSSVVTTSPYSVTLSSAAGTGVKGSLLYAFQQG